MHEYTIVFESPFGETVMYETKSNLSKFDLTVRLKNMIKSSSEFLKLRNLVLNKKLIKTLSVEQSLNKI